MRKMPDGVIYTDRRKVTSAIYYRSDASKTFISKRVYEFMKTEDRPELKRSIKLVGASLTEIKELEKVYSNYSCVLSSLTSKQS